MPQPERTAPMVCPGCGTANDGRMDASVTVIYGADGDVSVCFYCSAIAIYVGTPPVALREPTEQELAEIKADPGIQKLLADLTLYRMANPR